MGGLGYTPRDVDAMYLPEMLCALDGYQERQKGEWRRTLALIRTVVSVAGGDPDSIPDIDEEDDYEPPSREEWQRLVAEADAS